MNEVSVAELLATAFAANKVERIFGLPGGGSSLDIIQAAADKDIEFVLTRTENAAVMMAATTSELSGTPGVALTTKGPGVASSANGVAHASLDRAAVILLTDGFTSDQQSYITHQVFDQQAMLAPVTKSFSRLDGGDIAEEIKTLIDVAMTPPLGPVQIEMTGEAARRKVHAADFDLAASTAQSDVDKSDLSEAGNLLAKSVRPVVIVGLEARESKSASALREFVGKLKCPVLTTYKAKGVISDLDEHYVGIFTGGAAEAECVDQADLILLCGVDPVEFVLLPWRYDAPVIDIARTRHPTHYVRADVGIYGSIEKHLSHLAELGQESEWSTSEIKQLNQGFKDRLQYRQSEGIGPQQVVEMALDESQTLQVLPRITVDAGAHMFSAMAFWPCAEPHDALISNGLATMAFALPAAIAASLHQPDRAVIAFTGDGGLLMCLGELSTAVQEETRIIVIVFNDASLSLIDIKQQQRELPTRGVRWGRPDFAQIMTGLGGRGYRAQSLSEYQETLAEALRGDGPALIDVLVEPDGYSDQLKALRG
jgi:acetolactate synthase-1/2/3 large subunit